MLLLVRWVALFYRSSFACKSHNQNVQNVFVVTHEQTRNAT